MKIGVVCDDFTGTASAGVLLAKAGAHTGLFFDSDLLIGLKDSDRLDAAYVSSNSRHLTPEKAQSAVRDVTEALLAKGAEFIGKKIDTTLRGGIGYEVDAMLDLLGDDYTAVLVSTMPQSKRICVGGYSIIDSTILTETFVANDVINPVRECFVPDMIQAQTRHKVSLINIRDVLKGVDQVRQCLENAHADGSRFIIVDSISMDHIETIAKACKNLQWNVLPVDPGPFTMCLAKEKGYVPEEAKRRGIKSVNRIKKPALFVVGSANPETKKQIELLEASEKVTVRISVSPEELIEGNSRAEEEIQKVAGEAARLLQSASNELEAIIIETALHDSVLKLAESDIKHGYKKGTSSWMINHGLGMITKQILELVGKEAICGLLLTGGDTMEQVSREIGVTCIEAIDNITAQIDIGRIIGKYDGLPVIVKGGFCGYDTVAIDILDRLRQEGSVHN